MYWRQFPKTPILECKSIELNENYVRKSNSELLEESLKIVNDNINDGGLNIHDLFGWVGVEEVYEDSNDNGNFADLQYRFYFDGEWTTWVSKMTQEISYSTPGEKEVKIMTRDERRKESEEITLNIIVKANTQPIAILTSSLSDIIEGEFVTFDDSFEHLEGSEPLTGGRVIIFSFPSEARAREWFADPEYQEIAKFRREGAPTMSLSLVKGLPPRN